MAFIAIGIFILVLFIAYLFGSLSSAILTCKLLRLPDPRTQGSKNPGATNVLRIGGKKAAIMTLVGDMLKGAIPVLVAKAMWFNPVGLSLVALAAFLGHLYPIFFRFQGGKGVATVLGCFLAIFWPLGLALIATWLIVAIIFRYSSLAALIMALVAPLYTWYFMRSVPMCFVVIFMMILLIFRHRINIRNLLQGKEDKIGNKKIKARKAANEDRL